MDSFKKLLRDALASMALATRAAARLSGMAALLAMRAADATLGLVQRLVRFSQSDEVRKKTKEARKTADKAATRGRRAVVKLAHEAEARRTGRNRRAGRARRWGVVGAGVAAAIAVVLYVPRKLMARFKPAEPEAPSEAPATPTPDAPDAPAAEPPTANASEEGEAPAASRRRNSA